MTILVIFALARENNEPYFLNPIYIVSEMNGYNPNESMIPASGGNIVAMSGGGGVAQQHPNGGGCSPAIPSNGGGGGGLVFANGGGPTIAIKSESIEIIRKLTKDRNASLPLTSEQLDTVLKNLTPLLNKDSFNVEISKKIK